jgi:hypothetical protein
MSVYIVETRIGFAWENVWSEDGVPMSFDSADEAQAEIEDTLDSIADACQRGDMSCEMSRDDFRISRMGAA